VAPNDAALHESGLPRAPLSRRTVARAGSRAGSQPASR
jgi:hypothetical protein